MRLIKKDYFIYTLLSFGLLLLSIDVLIQNIKYSNRINELKEEIKAIKLDYQFLRYNKEQLEEYRNGKQKNS